MGRKIPGLGDYLHQARKRGKLLEINTFCDPILEMGEVAARWSKGREPGKALLFTNSGTGYPVAMNLYGSREAMLGILRANSYEEIEARIARLLRAASGSPIRIGRMLLEALWSRDLRGIIPRKCRGKAPCQEVVELTPNLHTLPLLQTWPADGGRFITLPMVITKSFSTGRRNVGMYRAQLFDGQTLGLHWHVHKTGAAHYREWKEPGECMPVAIVLGGDPLLAYCATAPLPDGIDEWMMAGFLRRRTVRQVRCVSIDLEVPAEADIVIEGYVDTAESLRMEGPFGDHTGFYSLADLYPSLHVTCITHRHNAVLPATIVGPPPMEDAVIAEATERIFLSPLRETLAKELVDFTLPSAGVAHNLAIVSIRKEYAGQPERIANLFWSAGQLSFTKVVVAVPEWVDVRNWRSVLAHVVAHAWLPKRWVFGCGPLDVLDHASSTPLVGGKLLIDATAGKPHNDLREEYSWQAISAQGCDGYCLTDGSTIPFFALSTSTPYGTGSAVEDVKSALANLNAAAKQCPVQSGQSRVQLVALFDTDAPIANGYSALWLMLANIDAAEDVKLAEGKNGLLVCVDARMKFGRRDAWPNVVTQAPAVVEKIDAQWESMGLGEPIESPSRVLWGYARGRGAEVER